MDSFSVEDFLTVSYRADLEVLLARWQRPIELAEMQRGYEALLAAAVAGGYRRWLLDVRRRFDTHRIGAQWMVSTLLPQLGPRLGGRTRLAYLLAPMYLRSEDADAAFPPPAFFVGQPFVADRFVEEQAAIAWLCAPEPAG